MNSRIPKTTTAAVLRELGKPLEIISGICIPPLSRGQVLVEIFFSGLCQSQVKEIDGARGKDNYLPHMLGHEGTGRVLSIGDGVKKVCPGDQVVLGWIKGSGLETGGMVYETIHGEKINAGAITTFGYHAIVSENRLVKLPAETPIDLGVLYGCALPTGAGIIFNEISLSKESNIIIFGLGGVGLSALIAAKTFQPRTLIAIDIEKKKLDLAVQFGATHVFNSSDENLLTKVKNITGGSGADFAIEAAGFTETIELAFGLIKRNGGKVVFATHPASGEKISIDPFELICGKNIKGSWGGNSKPDHDIPRMNKLYAEGQLPLEKFLSHRFTLENINDAVSALRDRKIVRALITMSHN